MANDTLSRIRANNRRAAETLGVRSKDLAALLEIARSTVSAWVKRCGVTRYDDQSWHTEEMEAYLRGVRNVEGFTVPDVLRGKNHRIAAAVAIPELDAPSAEDNGVVQYDMAQIERRMLYYRAQNEMLQAQQRELGLEVQRGNLIERQVAMETLSSIVAVLGTVLDRFGAQLAPSLMGLDNEREIRRRIDQGTAQLRRRLQDELHQWVEGLG